MKSPSDVDRVYSPSHWGYALRNPERAYAADSPTVSDIANAFGDGYAAMWVRGQLLFLYGMSPSRDKAAADGIKPFAECFTALVKPYKLSELMLFFARYRAGMYDNSFAQFDTRRIGNAFFREFVPERNTELDRINRKAVLARIERRRFTPPEGYTSLSWYEELKRRAATRKPRGCSHSHEDGGRF